MINITKLSNGMTIATDAMQDVESVSINLLIKVGSRNESKAMSGMSHFLEHMAFKGTASRTSYQIAKDFDFIGADFNAYTSREYTVFKTKTLKNDVRIALEIIADIVQNSVFDEHEIDKELDVILQEIAANNDDPEDVVFDYFQEMAFPNQAIGRSILGLPETISKFKQDIFKQYVAQYYTSNNMILSVAGNVDHDQIVLLADKYFNNLSNSLAANVDKCQYFGGKKIVEKDLEQVQFVMGFKSFGYQDDNFIASQLLSGILGGGMSSRLFQEIRERRALAYSVCAFNNAYHDFGVFCVYAATSEQKINETYQTVIEEFNKLSNHVAEDELIRAKNQLRSSIFMARDSTGYRASDLAKNIAIYQRAISPGELISKIDAVDTKQVTAVMKNIISDSLPTIALLGKTAQFSY